jgi:kinesin family protein 23
VYSFNQIFDETKKEKQSEIFDRVCKPMVQDLLEGKNGLLFTNGFNSDCSIMDNLDDENGLLRRLLNTLFNSISFQQAKKYVNPKIF